MSLKSPREDVLGEIITPELIQITRIHLAPVKGSSHAIKLSQMIAFSLILYCIALSAFLEKKKRR